LSSEVLTTKSGSKEVSVNTVNTERVLLDKNAETTALAIVTRDVVCFSSIRVAPSRYDPNVLRVYVRRSTGKIRKLVKSEMNAWCSAQPIFRRLVSILASGRRHIDCCVGGNVAIRQRSSRARGILIPSRFPRVIMINVWPQHPHARTHTRARSRGKKVSCRRLASTLPFTRVHTLLTHTAAAAAADVFVSGVARVRCTHPMTSIPGEIRPSFFARPN
jgi:hypothetical protein